MIARSLLLAGSLFILDAAHAPGALALQVQRIDLRVADLVYNPSDGMLYVSIPGAVPAIGNTVTKIDPVTGVIGPSAFVGSEPGKLALAGDHSRLYVALDGAAAVRVVELPAFTAGLQFPLGSDSFFGPFYAEDIAVQPGNPNVVLISLKNLGISPRHAGVAVFENGVARPTMTPRHTGSNRIEFSSDPARAYGLNNETTEFGFRRLSVSGTGVTELDVTQDLLSGFSLDIHYDAGRIYATNGQVIDPESKLLLGRFPLPAFTFATAAAPDGDRAYYVAPDGGGGAYSLYEFDTATFTPVLVQPIPGVVGSVPGMVRWGVDGLALRTGTDFSGEGGEVVILRRIHEPPKADLEVSIDDGIDPATAGGSFAYSIVARNDGPEPAERVSVRGDLPAGVTFQFASSTQGSCVDSSGTLVCSLFQIDSDQSASINAVVTPHSAGTLSFTVTVASQTQDDDPADNSDSETTEVIEPGANDANLSVRWIESPTSGSVGSPLVFSALIENHGPAEAQGTTLSLQFFGADVEVVEAGGINSLCPAQGPSFQCEIGPMPAGEFSLVRASVIPHQADSLYAFASVGSTAPDPVSANNFAFASVGISLSAEVLLSNLIEVVTAHDLNPGTEKTLVRELEQAQAALAEGDSAVACAELDDFVTRLERKIGHGVTLEQAFELYGSVQQIAGTLGCEPSALAALDHQRFGTAPSLPSELSLEVTAQSAARCDLRVSLPQSGPARLDLLDVRGRLVRTLLRDTYPAGTSTVDWDLLDGGGARVRPGVYFARLVAGDRRAAIRLIVGR